MPDLEVNNTCILFDLSSGKTAINCKWIYKIKIKTDGTVERYNVRLVVKGFTEQKSLDYGEAFSPVDKMTLACSMIQLENDGLLADLMSTMPTCMAI